MALRKIGFRVEASEQGQRIDHVLPRKLSEILGKPISKSLTRKLIVIGAVYLDRKRMRIASRILQQKSYVEVIWDESQQKSLPADRPFELGPEQVLYEDEWVIAVSKPPGLPSQATLDQARDHLVACIKRFLSRRDQVTAPYLGQHHRLDRDTSGVMIFAKRKEANAGLASAFAEHRIQKTYLALSARQRQSIPAGWVVKNHLASSPKKGMRSSKVQAVARGGDYAETAFRAREIFKQYVFIEAQPKTGRMHQIRVHLADDGLPILGDLSYGKVAPREGEAPAPRLMLHAWRLELMHPVTGKKLVIECPLPRDFEGFLTQLRGR